MDSDGKPYYIIIIMIIIINTIKKWRLENCMLWKWLVEKKEREQKNISLSIICSTRSVRCLSVCTSLPIALIAISLMISCHSRLVSIIITLYHYIYPNNNSIHGKIMKWPSLNDIAEPSSNSSTAKKKKLKNWLRCVCVCK